MTSSRRSLPRTIANLLLALVNATLILLALCLFLGWKTASEMTDMTARFAQNLIEVEPVRDEVRALRDEVAGLRSDLSTLGTNSAALPATVQSRISAIEGRIDGLSARMASLADAPERLMSMAVQQTTEGLATTITRFSGCIPSPAPTAVLPPPS